jgi:hypothetical protein
MERFQRAKLERQAADIRRELWAWVEYYKAMGSDVARSNYDWNQLQLADQRAVYLEDVANTAERLEELLAKQSVP